MRNLYFKNILVISILYLIKPSWSWNFHKVKEELIIDDEKFTLNPYEGISVVIKVNNICRKAKIKTSKAIFVQ